MKLTSLLQLLDNMQQYGEIDNNKSVAFFAVTQSIFTHLKY